MADLSAIQKELDALGFVAVRRLMDVGEFCGATGLCNSAVMHGLGKLEHLMVRTPFRRILFDAVKVTRAIENGELRGHH